MPPYVNNVPDNLRVGGGADATYMHPIVLAIVLAAVVAIWVLPRKYVFIPFLLAVFLTPFGQQLYVGGAHFFVARLLTLCIWIRILLLRKSVKGSFLQGGLNRIDKVFLLWASFRATATFLEFISTQALINQAGFLIDWVGGYFLLRFLIRNEEDMARVVKTFAVIMSVLAVTMTIEKVANQNVFGYLGGRMVPVVRDGAIRAAATFVGPIPAGTCAATIICLFIWLWYSGRSKVFGLAGIAGSLVMVVTSASSTPVMALPAGIAGILMWPLRKNMKAVRWGLVLVLVGLHLVMKAPVWMLIHHVDVFGASSGFHRAMLVDGFIRHFSDWWLIGVRSTASWGWDMWDQANQFVAEGETGGLATFICFVLLISWCFGRLGTARRRAQGDRKRQWTCWLLGCALFSHVVAFFGISFSDQSGEAWLALLAIICAATAPVAATSMSNKQPSAEPERIPEWEDLPALASPAASESLLVRLRGNVTAGGTTR